MNSRGRGLIKIIIILMVVGLIVGGLYFYFSRQIPEISEITEKEEAISLSQEEKIEEETISQVGEIIPTPTEETISLPPVTITPFQLKSDFFKDNSIAQAIASGAKNNVDIREFKLKYPLFDLNPYVSTEPFAYRVMSAIRMLGYTKGFFLGNVYLSELVLNKYQRFNNLPLSPLVTADILQRIDKDLTAKEDQDSILAKRFPLFSHFINAPLNEPTKEHSAALFTIVFESLPNHLVVWNEENFKDYTRLQLLGHLKNPNSSNYQFCDIALYPLTDECGPVIYMGVQQVNKIAGGSVDDFDIVTTKIHEYAHFLDRNIYSRNSNTSQGLIDTTDFYAISYDISSPYKASNGWTFYPLQRPNAIAAEFTNSYARGWEDLDDAPGKFTAVEDFAEAFTMYVTQGKVFRELAKLDTYLQQKYNWLKQNVFANKEYESGKVIGGIASTKQQLKNAIGSSFANSPRDYSQIIPNFVWNYGFSEGSVTPKP